MNKSEQAITVRLPEKIWRRLKILAMDNKTSVKALVNEAVAQYLEAR